MRVLPFVPLALGIFTIPWVGFVSLMAWYDIGDFEPTRAQSFIIDVASLLPAIIGLLVGITLLTTKRKKTLLARVFALTGSAACALLICIYIWQDIQWHIRFGYGTGR